VMSVPALKVANNCDFFCLREDFDTSARLDRE
jgi:hypothetical protein